MFQVSQVYVHVMYCTFTYISWTEKFIYSKFTNISCTATLRTYRGLESSCTAHLQTFHVHQVYEHFLNCNFTYISWTAMFMYSKSTNMNSMYIKFTKISCTATLRTFHGMQSSCTACLQTFHVH